MQAKVLQPSHNSLQALHRVVEGALGRVGNCCSVASIVTCYFKTCTSHPQGDQHSLIIKPMLRRFTHQVAVTLSEREKINVRLLLVLNKHSCFHTEDHFSDE